MRPLIHYDLDEPYTTPPAAAPLRPTPPPPAKKRKRNHRNPQRQWSARPQKTPIQHWDDPGSAAVGVVYDEQEGSPMPVDLVAGSVKVLENVEYAKEEEEEYNEEAVEGYDAVEEEKGEEEEEEEEEESRPLTHEEMWDDSALIDAWNSAEAEYEAYHGTSKAWQAEPMKKSPLWYNKPYTAPSKPNANSNNTASSPRQEQEDGESYTAPLDFNTFVPTHDPSLGIRPDGASANPVAATQFSVPPPSTMMVSRDEVFNNALSAMYWSGYWTAVYHCQSQSSRTDNSALEEAIEENGVEADEDEDEQDLIPAQR